MSSTSSGLLCKMAAASLNVTPSKLVLFREMSRPPGKKQQIIKESGCHVQQSFVSVSGFCVFVSGCYLMWLQHTRFDSSIFVCRPIRHNGSNEDPKIKFTSIVFPHYYKA